MKFERFLSAYPLVFWPFTMLLHFSLKKNSPKFASATTRKRGLIASCCTTFSAKRIAICTKTQCILHQNAVHFAPKRKVKCSKTRGKMQQKRGKMQQDATKINKETAF